MKQKPNEYAIFLQHLINKSPRKLTREDVDDWPYPYEVDSNESNIINEIAKKFNQRNPEGFKQVEPTVNKYDFATYGTSNDLELNEGEPDSKDYNFITIPSKKDARRYPPHPLTLAHELVHANDHQGDNLNQEVWNNLRELYNKNGDGFNQSIPKIQNKIDPSKVFSSKFYSPLYVRQRTSKHINKWERETKAWNDQEVSKKPKSIPTLEWPEIFNKINNILDKTTKEGQKNYHFLIPDGSEYPAFISENLTNSWRTDQDQNPLNRNEQEFLHSTLGNMAYAYPNRDYPTMHNFINKRKNSIEKTNTWRNVQGQQNVNPQLNQYQEGVNILKRKRK